MNGRDIGRWISLAAAFWITAEYGIAIAQEDADWAEFRGPNRSGVSRATGLPLTWNARENIVWKTPLPGRGASSPIVWRDRVYVTAYSGYGLKKGEPDSNLKLLQRHLLCVRQQDGAVLWKVDRPKGPDIEDHPIVDYLDLHGYASNTPVADGTGVYVYFGTSGVVAYGHDGKQKWERQLGIRYYNWGTAASPILFENLVIVHADIESQALMALDKRTGREVWRVPTGDRDSWSTPLIVHAPRGPELVFHHSQGAPATLSAVDPRTGAGLWQCRMLKDYLCPSPIVGDGVIYSIAYKAAAAVAPESRGEASVQWEIPKGSEVCTPVFHEGHLYWHNDDIAYCVAAKTGAVVYQERLQPHPGRIYASGVIADGKLYYVSRENGTYVLPAEPRFKLLAHNTIDTDKSIFNATPAISRGRLLLRSDAYLYCIDEK